MTEILPGIYDDMPNDEYHSDTKSISRTALLEFKRNRFKYWAKYLNPDRPPSLKKKAFEFGTAFHTLILEPKKFKEMYTVKPYKVLKKDVGAKAYKQYKDALKESEEGNKHVLTNEEYLNLMGMKKALENHKYAADLVFNAEYYERSYFWKDKETGLTVKCRPDILYKSLWVDLKTITDASEKNYFHEMRRYGYDYQAAMNREGLEECEKRNISRFINVCVETKYPYAIGIYIFHEDLLEKKYLEYKQDLLELKSCIDHNTFDDYEAKIIGASI